MGLIAECWFDCTLFNVGMCVVVLNMIDGASGGLIVVVVDVVDASVV